MAPQCQHRLTATQAPVRGLVSAVGASGQHTASQGPSGAIGRGYQSQGPKAGFSVDA